MTLKITEEGKKKLALGTGAAGFVVSPRSVQILPGARVERLEKFRKVHTEQEDIARREAIRIFIEHIREALKDERSADTMYENYAREAEKIGFSVAAAKLRGIAADERRHYLILNEMISIERIEHLKIGYEAFRHV
jgi:rubrerythrin